MVESKKFETAKKLAETHIEVDPSVQTVFLLESTNDDEEGEPIKLLEIVDATIERGIEPVYFVADPSRGIRYPSLIVELSPNEYKTLPRPIRFRTQTWHVGRELASRG